MKFLINLELKELVKKQLRMAHGEEELEKDSLHEERWTSKKNDSSIIINMKI